MAELLDRAEDGCLAGGIQQCGGFIQKQQRGFAGQRSRNGQSLLLPPTQGVNRPAGHSCKPNLLHEPSDSKPLLRATQA